MDAAAAVTPAGAATAAWEKYGQSGPAASSWVPQRRQLFPLPLLSATTDGDSKCSTGLCYRKQALTRIESQRDDILGNFMDVDDSQKGSAHDNGLVNKIHHQLKGGISSTDIFGEESIGAYGSSLPDQLVHEPPCTLGAGVRPAEFCCGGQPLSDERAIITAATTVDTAAVAILALATMVGCDEEYSQPALDSQAHLGRGRLLLLPPVSTDGDGGIYSNPRYWKQFLIKTEPKHIIVPGKAIAAEAVYHLPTSEGHSTKSQTLSSQFNKISKDACRLFKYGSCANVIKPFNDIVLRSCFLTLICIFGGNYLPMGTSAKHGLDAAAPAATAAVATHIAAARPSSRQECSQPVFYSRSEMQLHLGHGPPPGPHARVLWAVSTDGDSRGGVRLSHMQELQDTTGMHHDNIVGGNIVDISHLYPPTSVARNGRQGQDTAPNKMNVSGKTMQIYSLACPPITTCRLGQETLRRCCNLCIFYGTQVPLVYPGKERDDNKRDGATILDGARWWQDG